jgi:hypothetical protein
VHSSPPSVEPIPDGEDRRFPKQDSLEIRPLSPGTAATRVPASSRDNVKRSVKDSYDRFGWGKKEQGTYNDTAIWSQKEPVGDGLYEMMSHLSVLNRSRPGS